MNALAYKPVVTVIDVLDAGACIDGVVEFIAERGGIIKAKTQSLIGVEWVAKAANANINGYGGYGGGNGDGYGGYGGSDGYGGDGYGGDGYGDGGYGGGDGCDGDGYGCDG